MMDSAPQNALFDCWDKACLYLSSFRGLGFEAISSGVPLFINDKRVVLAVPFPALRCDAAKSSIENALSETFPSPGPKLEWAADAKDANFSGSWANRILAENKKSDMAAFGELIQEPFFVELAENYGAVFLNDTFRNDPKA